MGVSIDKIISKFSSERQLRIKKNTEQLIEEFKSLQAIRKAVGLTQVEVAEKLSIKQVNVSQLENREDMHLSTLRKYVEALGCELQINIVISDHEEALLLL